MHSFMIAASFLLMVLSPCLVALRSGSMPDEEMQ